MDARADGRPVALARMLLAVALAWNVLESGIVLSAIAGGRLHYPLLAVVPAPTPFAVTVYVVLGLLAAGYLLLGLGAHIAAAAGALLSGWALLWDQQLYSSHHLFVTLLLIYLAFARSDARWSLHARLRGGRDLVPWWPQLLMLTQVSVLYLFAALSKINPVFLDGGSLQGWMRPGLPEGIFPALAIATIATELFLAVGLWVPRVRWLAAAAGVGLHLSIVVGLADQTLPLVGFALASLSTYGMFLRRPQLGGRRGSPSVPPPATSESRDRFAPSSTDHGTLSPR